MPHPSRRDFVWTSAAGIAAAMAGGRVPVAPRVTATPMPFYGHPEGATTLIRFRVTELAAPAGRLRVYDTGRRLLGTAGVLNTGTELVGELWLALPRSTAVVTELEAPGIRGIHRTSHRLMPPPKWTAYWLAVVDPRELERQPGAMAPVAQAVRSGVLRNAGLVVNPRVKTADDARDHVRFLRQGQDAIRVQRTLGIPVSPVAWVATGVPPVRVLAALAGSGVTALAHPAQDATVEAIRLRDGTALLVVGVPPQAWGAETGMQTNVAAMEQRIGGWLAARSVEDGPVDRTVMLVSDDLESAVQSRANIDEWNRRYAYPRFVIGAPEPRHFPSAPVASVPNTTDPVIPDIPTRNDVARADAERRLQHVLAVFAPLAQALGGSTAGGLDTIAAAIGSAMPGTVVFNPSPFARTDHLPRSDGSYVLATDVPPLGYAYLVDTPDVLRPSPLRDVTPALVADTAGVSLELHAGTGAIASILDAEGTQWVGTGLNEVRGSNLERVQRQELPQVGVRIVLHRTAPMVGAFITTITLYDARPWVDVVNDFDVVSGAAPEVRFHFGAAPAQVMWEVPGGVEARAAPVPAAEHLRWVHFVGAQNVFFRALDAPWFSVGDDGALISHAPSGVSRYRFASDTLPATAAHAARVGWSAEPLVAAPARGGDGPLPRWGSLFQLDQSGAAVVGVTDSDEHGVTLFIQELSGTGRTLSLGGELLQFRSGEVVDFMDRTIPGAASRVRDGVTFPIRGHGFTALRLSGLTVR
jgi:hypothetical protein